MRRLLVVEDDASIAESLVDFFAARDFVVVRAPGRAAAEAAQRADRFALVLLDLRLPDGDGLDLLRAMRRGGDATPVIVLTARGEEAQRVLGLRIGADDYVVKPFGIHELAARIEAVLRRTGAPPATLRVGDVQVDLDGHQIVRGTERHPLAAKEAELLAFFLRNPGRTFARDELLREVWGFDAMPTTRTVDTHVFQLRQKLEPAPERPRHLVTVHGVGYKLVL